MQETFSTNHKVITALDGVNQTVLGGQEDGVVKLYDLRSNLRKSAAKSFSCHQRYISCLKINGEAENVFLTASYDGKVKVWDTRNEIEPISVLKRKTVAEKDSADFKAFALAWNGASQILSAGSDSHISIHEI